MDSRASSAALRSASIDLRAAMSLIAGSGSAARNFGACTLAEVAAAERILQLTFPPDYVHFICRYRALSMGPLQVFGLPPLAGRRRTLDVVEETLAAREHLWLTFREAVVARVDDGRIAVLDTQSGHCGFRLADGDRLHPLDGADWPEFGPFLLANLPVGAQGPLRSRRT